MSIVSFSLQGDTTDRITAREREIATYERNKVLDGEIKIGTFLLRLPESQLKTHLLMRVDTVKNGKNFRSEVVAISRAISTAQTQPIPMHVGSMSKRTPSKGGKGAKGGGKRNNQTQQAYPRCGSTDHTSANCPPTSTRRAEHVEKSVIRQVCVDLLELLNPKPKGGQKGKGGRKGSDMASMGTCLPGVVGRFYHSEPSGQPGHHHGWRSWKRLRPWQRE